MPEISHKLSEVAWCAFRDSNKPALYNQIRDALEAYEAAKNETAEASVTNALERLDAIASYQPRPNMKRELRELAELFRQALAKPASEPADGAVREALKRAEADFEVIRTILVKQLDEPVRRAFWLAVSARDAVRATLSAPASSSPAEEGER